MNAGTSTTDATIPREPQLPPAQDFAALIKEAREWLPEWARETWSDFNEHDPGIIILEQVLYALTELSYRADLPVPSLLTNERGEIPYAENSIHPPAGILPMQPLTAGDFVRQLYDDFPDLVYAAVEPAAAGWLQPWVAFDPDRRLSREAPGHKLTEVNRILAARRNLGECFAPAKEWPMSTLEIAVELRPPPGVTPQAVENAILQAAKRVLLPGPRFRSFASALETLPADQILSGPRLTRGIILDEDLPELMTQAEAEARVTRELVASGMLDVAGFTFPVGASSAAKKTLFVPKVQRVAVSETRGEAVLPEMSSAPVAGLLGGLHWDAPAVETEPSPVGAYHSIQHHFPGCFALQPDALPDNASSTRRAQVAQLKGYLLIFEQLMANFLAQLAHTADFFSREPQVRVAATQPLIDVPDAMPLFAGFPEDTPPTDAAERQAQMQDYWNSPANPYRTALSAIAENEPLFRQRRHRVLDHLLARFNEVFPEREGAPVLPISAKESLLRDYPWLAENRAVASVWSRDPDAACSRLRSGLEHKVHALLARAAPTSPVASSPPGEASQEDFYFVIDLAILRPGLGEPIESSGGQPTLAAGAELWDSTLVHVFIGPPFAADTAGQRAAFVQLAETLVRENAPAHLLHRFAWIDPLATPEAAADFRARITAWAQASFPRLRAVKTTDSSRQVQRDTPAGQMLAWLIDNQNIIKGS